jgi:hypothetical protein
MKTRTPTQAAAAAIVDVYRQEGFAKYSVGIAEILIARPFGATEPRVNVAWWSSSSDGPRSASLARSAAADLSRAAEIAEAAEALLKEGR